MILLILANILLFTLGSFLGTIIRYIYNNWNRHLSLTLNLVNLEAVIGFDYFTHGCYGKEMKSDEFIERRDYMATLFKHHPVDDSDFNIELIQLPCDMNKDLILSMYIVTPKSLQNEKTPLLIYNHGGGFVWGDWNSKKKHCLALCQSGIRVLYLEYFLCPEYRSPYQYDNIKQCLQWVTTEGPNHNIDINKIILMGQSAGAGMIPPGITFFNDLHMSGKILGAILMYPSLGGGVNLLSYRERQYGYGINFHQVVALYNVLYNKKSQLYDEQLNYFSNPDTFHNFPPFYIHRCEYDILRSSSERFSNILKQANVPVYEKLWKKTVHGFFGAGKEGKIAVNEVNNEIEELINNSTPNL